MIRSIALLFVVLNIVLSILEARGGNDVGYEYVDDEGPHQHPIACPVTDTSQGPAAIRFNANCKCCEVNRKHATPQYSCLKEDACNGFLPPGAYRCRTSICSALGENAKVSLKFH